MIVSRAPRIALAVQRLAPAGGLEQHALRLAEALRREGADPVIFTTRPPEASLPQGVQVEVLPARGLTNHGRLLAFVRDAAWAIAAGGFGRSVAFHAAPGFDVLFLADPSRACPRDVRRWLPRYRTFSRLERAALGPAGASLALFLSSAQRDLFEAHHPNSSARFELLTPTLDPRGYARAARIDKEEARARVAAPQDAQVWLWAGLQARTKGLDRTLLALAATPEAFLIVSGLASGSRGAEEMASLARKLSVQERVAWLGYAHADVLEAAFAAADLLVHPSRADVTATVIAEALASGLPVVATSVCGYAEHVARAGAGAVLPEPFRQEDFNEVLRAAGPALIDEWRRNATAYCERRALCGGVEQAAALILAAPVG